jgi:hypothetical protein
MLQKKQFQQLPKIFTELVTPADTCVSRRPTWVPRIHETDTGLVPTPTRTANHDAPSMLKHPGHQRYRLWNGGKTTPKQWEFLMGFPLGWTSLMPLTDSASKGSEMPNAQESQQ